MLFELGQIVATPGALEALRKENRVPKEFLARHVVGDWGDMSRDDKALNNRDLREGRRLMSSYRVTNKFSIWIITEWDRSVTTVLLPSEN